MPKRDTTSIGTHLLMVVGLSLTLIMGVVGWAATTELSGAVIAQGRVIVEGNSKKVQHLQGGVVAEVAAREGDRVEGGQLLVRLDGKMTRINLSIIDGALAQIYARRARLRAEISNQTEFTVSEDLGRLVTAESAAILVSTENSLFESRRSTLDGMKQQLVSRKQQLSDEIKGLQTQIDAFAEQLALLDEEIVNADSIYKKGLTTLERVNTRKRQKAELDGRRGQALAERAQAGGKMTELDLQLLQLEQKRQSEVSDELTMIETKATEYEERRAAALYELDHLEVRAPTAGRIHELKVDNVGAVIGAGEVIMQVVPENDNLEIEARVRPDDIDQISLNQPVDIRFSAFNQNTTPDVTGAVKLIAPDLRVDERTGVSYYAVRVQPDAASLQKLSALALYPGMPADVFLKTGDRVVVSYLMKPLRDRMETVFRSE